MQKHIFILILALLPALTVYDGYKPEIKSTITTPERPDPDKIRNVIWQVEDIAQGGVIDNALLTLRINSKNKVSGETGCNRMSGRVDIEDDALKFHPLAVTRRACSAVSMNMQEQKYLQTLEQVTSWRLDKTGLLYLKDANGLDVLRFSRPLN